MNWEGSVKLYFQYERRMAYKKCKASYAVEFYHKKLKQGCTTILDWKSEEVSYAKIIKLKMNSILFVDAKRIKHTSLFSSISQMY